MTSGTSDPRVLVHEAHHDGSERYIPDGTPALGDVVPVRLRVPAGPGDPGEDGVRVRVVIDGEPEVFPARVDRRTGAETWFVAEVPVHNPVAQYRFFLGPAPADPHAYRWLNGRGVQHRDVPDAADFRLTVAPPAPAWGRGGLVYQVFPDRFARSGRVTETLPAWALPRAWDDPVDGYGRDRARQLYGGDLWGIADHVDHLERLGVEVVYLTPFFPAQSNHRYDATTFDRVDPLLGGDAALADLARTLHARGIRLMGDLTTNHTGVGHEWFAQATAGAAERELYYWDADGQHVGWRGHASLPKLRYASDDVGRRMYAGPESVVARWLRGGGDGLDGWRVDVANMTGRYRDEDAAHAVARAIRATMADVRPDALLVGEHFHDAGADAQGFGWHAVMNYAAFTRPAWSWFAPAEGAPRSLELPGPMPRRGGTVVVDTMREFAAAVPWTVTSAQWNLLASHDTPRLRTIAGSRDVAHVAAALLLTYPGTPVVFAGEEFGLVGRNGEESRTPMPWDRPGDRDEATFAVYRDLVALRRSSRALREGGLRWLVVDDDAIAYVRETRDERVLVLLARAPWRGVDVPDVGLLGSGAPATMYGDRELRVEGSAGGRVLRLPGDGPAVHVWRLA
ncbi:glycoside hydrolase family 13 protein [Cellulomonas alba]|uniref:Glycoside hydrolase family 13 protein n=1 Tax=Cellulomonas alba TaxID=3053467 RepID=A0ABT7SC20_9CELL|nr:glycoside hydrolase family 13 protein [Cellulomonas alba]MDM7853736.1 glycoside hydrolase family 13 protein [Cellulomonas alba]